jgi:hypothetical protein
MGFERYLAAAPAPTGVNGVDPKVVDEAGKQAAGYQKDYLAETKVIEAPKVDSTIVEGSAKKAAQAAGVQAPKFVKGDFGFVYRDAKSIPSHVDKNQRLGSTIEFQDIGEGRSVSVISSNTALTNTANQNIGEGEMAALVDKQRKSVLMKMAIDGGLAKNIRVSPEDAEEAARMWITPTNAHRQFDIEKAWALVKQNTSIGTVGSTIESDQFTLRTRKKFGMTPSEYMVNGYSRPISGTVLDERGNDASEDVSDEIARRQAQILELEDKFFKKGEETNPHTSQIEAKRTEYEKEAAFLATLNSESPTYAKQKTKIASINTEIQQLNVASTSWDAQQQQRQRLLSEGRKGLTDLLERVKGGSASQLRAGMENASATGISASRWVGTQIKDVGEHFGYSAAAMDEIDPQVRNQWIIDNSVERMAGETAADWNKRRKVKDRTDNPELVWWLAKNSPLAFEQLSQSMPSLEEKKQSKLTTETLVNNSYHFNKLYDLNEVLRNSGFIEGTSQKLFSPSVRDAASARANLIGQMRVFIVGPGNPSNFEQEILHSIIPEIEAVFSRSDFHKERLRALAMISILAHHNEKVKLGLKANDTSIAMYNQRFGKLLGRTLTMEELDRFREFSEREGDAYEQMKQYGNIDVGDRQGGGYGTGKKTTSAYGQEYLAKVEKTFGR